jgi:uncharacterized coiled-coil protein SlyX
MEDISDALYEQHKEIDKLTNRVRILEIQIEDLDEKISSYTIDNHSDNDAPSSRYT